MDLVVHEGRDARGSAVPEAGADPDPPRYDELDRAAHGRDILNGRCLVRVETPACRQQAPEIGKKGVAVPRRHRKLRPLLHRVEGGDAPYAVDDRDGIVGVEIVVETVDVGPEVRLRTARQCVSRRDPLMMLLDGSPLGESGMQRQPAHLQVRGVDDGGLQRIDVSK